MSEKLTGVILKRSVALAQRTTSAQVVAGVAINISGVSEIKNIISASAVAAGTVGIQDVQFADDSSFSVNVSTFTSDDYLGKNDRTSSTSAIAQTLLSAAGSKSLSLKNLALNNQKYFRVRTVASSGSPDATFEVQTILQYLNEPQVQA
ncbi:MAG: hypothetical protein RIR01_1451 [Bacteroidota bacterium]|jgi:hypothetical protein